MANIGKAKVKIGLSGDLQNVNKSPKYSTFDLPSAFLKAAAENSDRTMPQSIDSEALEGAFTVLYPSKGAHYVNNYVDGDLKWDVAMSKRQVLWTPTDDMGKGTILNCFSLTKDYSLLLPSADYSKDVSYSGPRWRTRPGNVGSKEGATEIDGNDLVEGESASNTYTTVIEQYQSTPAMWWGVKTTVDFPKQAGMWLNINLGSENKTGKASFLVVNINPPGEKGAPQGGTDYDGNESPGGGVASPTDSFSIVIDEKGAYLIDYYNPYNKVLTEVPKSPSDWNKFKLRGSDGITGTIGVNIGVLPMIGYLAVYINGTSNIYPRRDKTDSSTLSHFTMKISEVQVYGRNTISTINMAAMIFSPSAMIEPPVISSSEDSDWKGSSTGHDSVIGGEPSSIAVYAGPNGKISCGACCKTFTSGGESACPSSSATDGFVSSMCPEADAGGAIDVTFSSLETKAAINFRMKIIMSPEAADCLGSDIMLNIKTPYLFRLRGNNAGELTSGADIDANIADVMSMSESWDSPDYVHVTHTVDVTLYNKGGTHNSLLTSSQGIAVDAGIGGDVSRIFTGITLDASTSEVAGKETLTVHCKDYMELLETNMFLNCPYYDGMLDINAAKDIAIRAGIEVDVGDGVKTGSNGYYLPAGYSFTEPRMKWSSETTLKDGLVNVCKLGEKIFYFDEEGVMKITALQGGLAFEGDTTSSASFSSSPDGADFNVILDEKRVEKLVGSVVSSIYVTSWDRVRGAIIAYQDVSNAQNVPYNKTLFVDQPAYGSVEAVVNWVNMIKDRVYKVPRRITFKTLQDNFSLKPLSFITVDGQKYRVKSMNRRFDAESNSLTSDITAEWFGD